MVNISKGDIIAEPLEFIIEILVRICGKFLAKNFPYEPIEHWHLSDWLVVLIPSAILFLIAWNIYSRDKKSEK
jgi:hypothetical protein